MELLMTETRIFGKPKHTADELARNVTIDPSNSLLVNGLYYCHLLKWLRYFDLEQFHYVDGHLLKEKPWLELAKIETFLGIEHRLRRGNFVRDHVTGQFNLRMHNRKGGGKGRKHPDMPEENTAKLRDFYRPFNEKLFELIGKRFPWDD